MNYTNICAKNLSDAIHTAMIGELWIWILLCAAYVFYTHYTVIIQCYEVYIIETKKIIMM